MKAFALTAAVGVASQATVGVTTVGDWTIAATNTGATTTATTTASPVVTNTLLTNFGNFGTGAVLGTGNFLYGGVSGAGLYGGLYNGAAVNGGLVAPAFTPPARPLPFFGGRNNCGYSGYAGRGCGGGSPEGSGGSFYPQLFSGMNVQPNGGHYGTSAGFPGQFSPYGGLGGQFGSPFPYEMQAAQAGYPGYFGPGYGSYGSNFGYPGVFDGVGGYQQGYPQQQFGYVGGYGYPQQGFGYGYPQQQGFGYGGVYGGVGGFGYPQQQGFGYGYPQQGFGYPGMNTPFMY